MAINAGYGDLGFFFNESGLQWGGFTGDFGGWLGESFPLPHPQILSIQDISSSCFSSPPPPPPPPPPSPPSSSSSCLANFIRSLRLVARHPAAVHESRFLSDHFVPEQLCAGGLDARCYLGVGARALACRCWGCAAMDRAGRVPPCLFFGIEGGRGWSMICGICSVDRPINKKRR